jgi:hypothetical protein
VTRIDAAAYIAWLRREPSFRSYVHGIREALRPEHGEDSRAELVDAVERVSSVLPPSARGLWTLLLDEGVDLVVGPSGSLEHEEWERLAAAVRARMLADATAAASNDVVTARFLEGALQKIDPAAPVLMPSAWIASPMSRAREAAA